MLPLKTIIALSVMPLLLTSAGRTSAQMLTDAYTLAETSADMPVTWEPWLAMNNSRRGESARLSEHHWVGRGEKGKKPDEPQKRKCGSGQVLIVLCHSPVEARANVEEWLKPGRMAVSPVRGSYTGAPLGDECLRCKVEPNGAYLRFCRGNAFFMVDVGGHQGCFDYPALAEKIARSLLTRTDAALALAASESNPVTTSLRPVGTRRPRGVPVMLVDEWAADAGASLQADWKSGMATVKRGAHKLRLMVGRRDALLDGKTVTLPFPALRYGKDRLWCPVVVLSKLTD